LVEVGLKSSYAMSKQTFILPRASGRQCCRVFWNFNCAYIATLLNFASLISKILCICIKCTLVVSNFLDLYLPLFVFRRLSLRIRLIIVDFHWDSSTNLSTASHDMSLPAQHVVQSLLNARAHNTVARHRYYKIMRHKIICSWSAILTR
jgi:hypothetical protein